MTSKSVTSSQSLWQRFQQVAVLISRSVILIGSVYFASALKIAN